MIQSEPLPDTKLCVGYLVASRDAGSAWEFMNDLAGRLTNRVQLTTDGHAIALYFAHYNFVRVHQTLRVTPAMQAGLTDHVWTLEELVGLLEAREAAAIAAGGMKRGAYRKTNQ